MNVQEYADQLNKTREEDVRREHEENLNHPKNGVYHRAQLKLIADGKYDYRFDFHVVDYSETYYRIGYNDPSIGGARVHAFVEKATGDVYGVLSQDKPRETSKYNLSDEGLKTDCHWWNRYL